MKYRYRPLEIEAFEIVRVSSSENCSSVVVELDGGGTRECGSAMTARMNPVPGDFYVVQPDGYEYLNPRDVFMRKFEKVGA